MFCLPYHFSSSPNQGVEEQEDLEAQRKALEAAGEEINRQEQEAQVDESGDQSEGNAFQT